VRGLILAAAGAGAGGARGDGFFISKRRMTAGYGAKGSEGIKERKKGNNWTG